MKTSHLNWKHKILALAIAIVITAFIFTGINLFYDAPMYDDFCEERPIPISIETEAECLNNNGKWTSYEYRNEPVPVEPKYDYANSQLSDGYCDLDWECRENYSSADQNYRRNVFIVGLILGTLILVGGIFITLPAISMGLMGGGLLTIIIAIMQYWSELAKWGRFIVLGLALAVLIWVGYKKLK
jgi:hypothetical protein